MEMEKTGETKTLYYANTAGKSREKPFEKKHMKTSSKFAVISNDVIPSKILLRFI